MHGKKPVCCTAASSYCFVNSANLKQVGGLQSTQYQQEAIHKSFTIMQMIWLCLSCCHLCCPLPVVVLLIVMQTESTLEELQSTQCLWEAMGGLQTDKSFVQWGYFLPSLYFLGCTGRPGSFFPIMPCLEKFCVHIQIFINP